MSHLSNLATLVESLDDIPQAAIERAKLALIDYIGVAIAGTVEPVSKIVTEYVGRRAHGHATVIGAGFRTHAADAALANATIGHALDFDDSNFCSAAIRRSRSCRRCLRSRRSAAAPAAKCSKRTWSDSKQ
jgi:2-methylcitrate dehydratase PrpD